MIYRVARSCHGKSNNFAAKEKDSRQKEEPHGKKKKIIIIILIIKNKNKKRLTAKRKGLTENEKTSVGA